MIISWFIGVCVLLFGPLVSRACNVTLYAQGEPLNFTSPNYPGNYISNDNCYWDIYPQTRGNNVVLDMVFSDIEGSPGSTCRYDALTIYVKHNGDQRIVESKRICGQSRLHVITREDQHFHVVFKTDGSVTRGGFLIRYYETDGHSCGVSDLSASSAAWTNLTSPGYPSNYSNNLDCRWTISAPVGYEIKVEVMYSIVQNSTACSSDYLLLSDGSTSFASQLGKYCGRSYITREVVSSRNYVTITFHTDGSDTAPGFNLKYKAGTFLTTTTERANELNCGSSLLSASTSTWRYLSSPGYPNYNYNNNMDCKWTISAPVEYKIKVEIIVLSVESVAGCANDYLLFNDGSSSDATQLGKYCDGTRNVVSSSNTITITFHTDRSISGRGFSLKYMARTSGANGLNCGSSLLSASTSTWRYLSSPGYPNYNYNNNMDCKWTISAPVEYKIKVEIIVLSVESVAGCANDYLLFNDGSSSDATQLGKYCDGTRNVVSSSNTITITFHTDRSISGRGFSLKYMARTSGANGLNCGSSLLSASTSTWRYLSSPGYPNYNYNNNMDCKWTISAPVEYKIKVEIIVLSVESVAGCANDYLLFNDGSSSDATQLGKYCDGTRNVVSSSNTITITFHTDRSISGRGFSLKYMARTSGANGLNCGSSLLSASTSTWRYLSSPGYPNYNYNNNMDCKWTISAPAGYKIKVEIIVLSVEYETTCARDYLLFSDGSSSYGTKLGKYCDGTRDVVSSSNAMTVTFHTDNSVTKRGFSFKYMARTSGCGTEEEINGYETKYIESPNYPLDYPDNADCSWTISTDVEGYVIHVKVEFFYLEHDSTCSYDYVQLYDVRGTYEHSLGRWCGSDGPDTQSTGLSMKVRFLSDASSTFTGFKLAFTAGEPTSSSSFSPNFGGVIGGVFGGIVGVAILTCCCCGICSRKKSTTNDQSQRNRSREDNVNNVFSIPLPIYPPTTATTLPAMFTPPPAYSEVVKDDPPPYCQAVPLSDIQPVVTSSPNDAYEGIDNPAGPS
ncbi:cubilin-like [Haliotis rufescens]|uniref:cubilin-like n=1 Tax=Haliotis rufescens TaxID=6454 RepID=UPI001EAFEE32|nr:cubilin-like [Haliotis rufescens]